MILTDAIAHRLGDAFPHQRVLRQIRRAIERLDLDLSGLTVLTEAATGFYRLTPVLSAAAGAERVIAVARDNAFGSAETAFAQVDDLARAAGLESALSLSSAPAIEHAHQAQLITNLGAVRPIDAAFIERLGAESSVSLMFGAVDARPADLDVDALRAAGVPICGVNEDQIGLFRWTGQRIAWWLTELGIAVVDSRITIWGHGAPADKTAAWLERAGALVTHHQDVEPPADPSLTGLDALILMSRETRIAPDASLSPRQLARRSPGAAVLEYAGEVDRQACRDAAVIVYPLTPPRAGHVARTIGEIISDPVVELHAAGLRVGELMVRARADGLDAAACEAVACGQGPGERLSGPWSADHRRR